MVRKIFDFKPPKNECQDENCPWHGSLPVRGKVLKGKIVKFRSDKTAVLEVKRLRFVRKYMRYERRKSRIHVHIPPCIELKEGEYAVALECRPLSKIKSFVVVQRMEV